MPPRQHQNQRQRRQRRQRRVGPPIDFNQRNQGIQNGLYQEIMYWGNSRNPTLRYQPDTPVNILREAFNEFIVNENIESNTLGIEIVYLENEGDTVAKNITIIKKKYNNVAQTRKVVNNNAINHFLDINDTGVNFPNSELTNLTRQIQGFHRILQITLCEIYNDDPTSISRRNISARNMSSYRPFTIPIRLLYRDMDREMVPPRPLRPWQIGYILSEQEQQQEREYEQRTRLRQAIEAQARSEVAIRQQQERQNQTPEQQAALLEDPFFNNYEDLGEGGNIVNPDPLEVVNDPELLNKRITSYEWPGMCQLCLDNDTTQPLCRVNCRFGHIFHCECINAYRNTRTGYGWNNKCPLCVQREDPIITSMVQLTPEKINTLPSSFGKKRSCLKTVDVDIKYLLKK